jgi:hypothetical protein
MCFFHTAGAGRTTGFHLQEVPEDSVKQNNSSVECVIPSTVDSESPPPCNSSRNCVTRARTASTYLACGFFNFHIRPNMHAASLLFISSCVIDFSLRSLRMPSA